MFAKAKSLYHQYERWVPILFFLLGFLFDTLMLRRIDEPMTIVQQAVYLLLSAVLIRIELQEEIAEYAAPRILSRVWRYREALLHFMLGTLLNSYTIFYFKSASAITSFVFIILLVALLILNEFKHFGESQTQVHVAFWSLCLVSYLISLAPILLGFIGFIPFLSAVGASVVVFTAYFFWVKPKLDAQPHLLRTHMLYPYAAIQILFVVFYFAHVIPPAPLSAKFMGIYHGVQRSAGRWELTYYRPRWKFWQHGDQTFEARPGDAVYCYVQIFSPARFKDRLQVRWFYHDAHRGWTASDAIPMDIVGGRDEGYRGFTKKENYQPGEWRVQVETGDGREIGRIGFTVEADPSNEPRETQIAVKE